MFFDLNLQEGYAVEQGIKCAQRANPFAEGTEEEDAQDDDGQQNAQLPGEECPQCRADTAIDERKRNSAFQYALRTEVLTEVRIPQSDLIDQEQGQQKDHDDQNDIF